MTKVEAASQNLRRRRIAIWKSGRGVYFISDFLSPAADNIAGTRKS